MTTIRRARREIVAPDESRREAVRQELEAVAAGQITDVMTWTTRSDGTLENVSVVASNQLSERARRAVKKVKITPTQYGDQIEIEMHDKLSALRILARAEGLMDGMDDQDKRPSLVGINLKGPEKIEGNKDEEANGTGLGDGPGDEDREGVSDRSGQGA